MNAIAVIPAHLESTRLPRKMLAEILGKPLVWHTWNRVRQCRLFDAVYVAVDSNEVYALVEEWGGEAIMTSASCQSGTERIVSCLGRLDAELIVNVQGDEPLVSPEMLTRLVSRWDADPTDLITPVFHLEHTSELTNPNIVKVARGGTGRALYFSRSPIPAIRDLPLEQWLNKYDFWGHIGVYGYRKSVLAEHSSLPVSPLELQERLEQLRFLDAGFSFDTVETSYRPVAVDVIEDLDRVRRLMGGEVRSRQSEIGRQKTEDRDRKAKSEAAQYQR